MRICYLGDAGSIHIFRFVKHFVSAGHTVSLFSMRPALKEIKKLDMQLHESPLFFNQFFLHAISCIIMWPIFLWKIMRFKPDVVHVHDAFSYGPFALLALRPYILTPWGTDVFIMSKKNMFFHKLIQQVVLKADCIPYDGENIEMRLLELGANPTKLSAFAFGVEVEQFTPEKHSEELRKEWSKVASFFIISSRMLEPVYDNATLIRASAQILKVFPQAKFLIIGDGSERNSLEALSQKLEVKESVLFLGKMSPDDLAVCLASSDIYVSTSLSDGGLAVSTAEAMASGLPVVITNFGDNAQWVKDGESSFLFPAQDDATLAKNIFTLLKDEKMRKNTGLKNVKIIRERKNYRVEMNKVEALYTKHVNNE